MVVNPASGNVYFSVGRGPGPQATPVILRLNHQGEFAEVPLEGREVRQGRAAEPVDQGAEQD